MEFILSFLIFAIHLLGMLAAGHAVLRGRTAEGTVAWVIFLILLPYIAFPMYMIFGQRRFQGYVNARRAGDFEINHL